MLKVAGVKEPLHEWNVCLSLHRYRIPVQLNDLEMVYGEVGGRDIFAGAVPWP